jgi:hypothetical protein
MGHRAIPFITWHHLLHRSQHCKTHAPDSEMDLHFVRRETADCLQPLDGSVFAVVQETVTALLQDRCVAVETPVVG